MLLRSLKMQNFRQFIDEHIEFATDKDRNVTVIMGEIGVGKTTIAQAFSWCLYGDTDFQDKIILNRIAASKLMLGEEATVTVQLDLVHAGTQYVIIAEQSYKKEQGNKLKAGNIVRNISYKTPDGQKDYAKPLEVEAMVKQILPREMSRYFFFDGERIGLMSKEIAKGRSATFALAVRGLLGLSAFISALEHLKPTSKYGVIGSYNDSYNDNTGGKVAAHSKTIADCQAELEKIESTISENDSEIALARDRSEELTDKIKQYAEGEQLQKQKELLERKLQTAKASKKNVLESTLKQFSSNAPAYFSKSLIKKSLELLSSADLVGKDIPEMHAKTIDFLIKRGECICGTKIELGNQHFDCLNEWRKFIPPHDVGGLAGSFIKESEIRAKASTELFATVSESLALLDEQEDTISGYISDIQRIEEKLASFKGVGQYQREYAMCQTTISSKTAESKSLSEKKGSLEFRKGNAEAERTKLSLLDNNNRKIEVYKAYAQFMYNELQKVYSENEKLIREKLQKAINDIFVSIYDGGMSLEIDEKYNIQVIVNEFDDFNTDVETSTAQSISVIFAFIAGIIKLARESNAAETESELLASEPYPLVMDAPLSNFDKRRIKTVCDTLPNIAEQVIIFIKDTDGEIAETHLGKKIGKRYEFSKISAFETKVI